jgi:hypothetical protein
MELIQAMSPDERTEMLDFAQLPFFNRGRMRAQVKPLIEHCIAFLAQDQAQDLSKEDWFRLVFGDQEYVEGKLDKAMVEAHKFIRSYLLVRYYFRENNEFFQTYDFSEILRTRGLDARHQYALSKLQRLQNDTEQRDASYYYRQFVLEKAIHDRESVHNQARGDLNIPRLLSALDIHTQINRLSHLNFFLLQQKAANLPASDYIQTLLDEGLTFTQQTLDQSPSLRIHYEIHQLLRHPLPTPAHIQGLFDTLKKHETRITPAELREFYTYLRSLCVAVTNHFLDDISIRQTLFELYKDNLHRGFLHYEGKLHPNTFLAVTSAAIRLHQDEWANNFIESYKKDILGENETHDLYRLNKALYLFGVGRFEECLDFIPPSSPFLDYLIHGKRLELKALYELNSDLFSYRLDAFKMFLSRTSPKLLPDLPRKLNVEFVNLLSQLASSAPGDEKRAKQMIQRIQTKKQAVEWRWLLEKAEALLPRNR